MSKEMIKLVVMYSASSTNPYVIVSEHCGVRGGNSTFFGWLESYPLTILEHAWTLVPNCNTG